MPIPILNKADSLAQADSLTPVQAEIAEVVKKITETPAEELISNKNSVEEVCKLIEADSLAFLSHEGMLAAGHRDDLCLACFNHKYPTDLYNE